MSGRPITYHSTDDGEREVLVEYPFDDDEQLEMAVASAFEQAGIDIMRGSESLQDAVDVDSLRGLHDGSAETAVQTTLRLYDRPVLLTSDIIRIYAAPDGT